MRPVRSLRPQEMCIRDRHGSLIDFQGGVAHNVVPDRAYALVRADASALKDTENVKVTAEADGVARISAFGKEMCIRDSLRACPGWSFPPVWPAAS